VKTATRIATAAGAAALALAFTVPTASAQVYPVTVTGQATCGTAGPVGRYTLTWTVTNGDGLSLAIDSATESGVFTGTVTITPNPIPASGSGTGSDGPVGNVAGQVMLSVAWTAGGSGTLPGTPGTSTATITLAGDCVIPPVSTTSTTLAPTTTVAAVAVVTAPKFTG
jgi:hypothetical protein